MPNYYSVQFFMDSIFERDNIIEWVFEKIFDQLTLECNEIYRIPYVTTKNIIFSDNVYTIINHQTGRSIEQIKIYLENIFFQKNFLFQKIKKRIHAEILIGDLEKINSLIANGYTPDSQSLQLAIINNKIDIVKYLVDIHKIPLTNDLLIFCCEFGYEQIYFYLKGKGLVPNISIYKKAVLSPSLQIIKDISQIICLNHTILETVLPTNQTEIIIFLLQEATKEKVKISPNLVTYPILNANFNLLNYFVNNNIFEWHIELYYSAILSGSIEMVSLLENNMPDIHDAHWLDTSKTKKGKSTLLLEDMIYEYNGKKYFSHCMNYAVQSESIVMVKYIHSKGYGITISNIITAIKQAPCTILSYLLENYKGKLPQYLIHYFGMNSYIPNKIEKAKMIAMYNIFSIGQVKPNVTDIRKETIHLEMIGQPIQLSEDELFDIDYLMKYQIFFLPINKSDHSFITKTKISLQLELNTELDSIYKSINSESKRQIFVDCLFLFGNIEQIKKLYPLLGSKTIPCKQIIMEIMCYCQINKLCYLLQNGLLTKELAQFLQPVQLMLGDKYIDMVFSKIELDTKPKPKYIICSGKKDKIIEYCKNNPNTLLTKQIFIHLAKLDDVELLKNFQISKDMLPDIIEWANKNDYLEMTSYLKTLS